MDPAVGREFRRVEPHAARLREEQRRARRTAVSLAHIAGAAHGFAREAARRRGLRGRVEERKQKDAHGAFVGRHWPEQAGEPSRARARLRLCAGERGHEVVREVGFCDGRAAHDRDRSVAVVEFEQDRGVARRLADLAAEGAQRALARLGERRWSIRRATRAVACGREAPRCVGRFAGEPHLGQGNGAAL